MPARAAPKIDASKSDAPKSKRSAAGRAHQSVILIGGMSFLPRDSFIAKASEYHCLGIFLTGNSRSLVGPSLVDAILVDSTLVDPISSRSKGLSQPGFVAF
jgi:hypothetical protein